MSAKRSSGPDPARSLAELTHWSHLARRFFGLLGARPLSPRAQSEVAALLEGASARLFWEQPVPDQRHALEVARRVLARRPGDRRAARAALLHDVGKRATGLGAVRRSLATLASMLGISLGEPYRTYLDHGRVGARDLEAIGADPLAVAFARHHPQGAPPGADPERWRALLDADRG